MSGKLLIGLAVAGTLFMSLCLGGSVNARKKELSSTRRVAIDGRTFIADESPPADESGASPHPVFSMRLKDSPARAPDAPCLPAGLIPEHTLRLEGEGAQVGLVFGKMEIPGPSIRSRLSASGWKSVSTGKEPGVVQVLQSSRGKETAIVCLDEAEGTFLHFREVGR